MDEFQENQSRTADEKPPERERKKHRKKRKQRLSLSIVSLVLFVVTCFGAAAMWVEYGVESACKLWRTESIDPTTAYFNEFDLDLKRILSQVQILMLQKEAANVYSPSFNPMTAYEVQQVFAQANERLLQDYGSTQYYAFDTTTGVFATNITGTNGEESIGDVSQKDCFLELSMSNETVTVTFHDANRPYEAQRIYTNLPYDQFAISVASYFNVAAVDEAYQALQDEQSVESVSDGFLYYLKGRTDNSQHNIHIYVPQEAKELPGSIRNSYNRFLASVNFVPLDGVKLGASALLTVACLVFLILFLRNAGAFFRSIGRGLRALFRQLGRLCRWNANWMGRIYLELKCAFLLLLSLVWPGYYLGSSLLNFYIFVAGLLLLFLFVCDLAVNRTEVFKHNLFRALLRRYRAFEKKEAFQQRLDLRFALCCAASVICLILMGIGLTISSASFVIVGLLLLATSVITYFALNYKTKADTQKLIDQIELMYNGEFEYGVWLPQHSDLYPPSVWLNGIRNQVESEIESRIKSERMKVELITNVSHDLKTPLTSMINYIDLLQDEELSPEFANDYVRVLHQKINRLKTMVEDLFDVAKANSGNLEVNREKIELGELVEQTLGEDSGAIAAAGLSFRVNDRERKVYVETDGPKMYRIVSNIVGNAVKYAMPGTRVYVDIEQQDGEAVLTVKNISNYEMRFTAEEIMERFKRGDDSRTAEGSGLGLSIVQSFASLLGGSFQIQIDGDLFKAVLRFPAIDPVVPSEPA